MEYKTTITDNHDRVIDVLITSIKSELDFKDKRIKDARAYCFCDGQFVLVWGNGHWNTPGGALEGGEDPRVAVRREVKEETNMKVVKQRFIFLQTYTRRDLPDEHEKKVSYQTVSACLVEPDGNFHSDPDGDITRIELVSSADYKKYLDWGERGDILMQGALDAKRQMDLEVNYVQ